MIISLQWCHNGYNGISNHQPHDCLLNWWSVNSPQKWPVTRKMRPFDELIMIMTWTFFQCGIYQLLVDSQHIEPLNRAWIFSLLWAWISFWTNLQVANEMSCINACMWCEPNVLSYQWFHAKFSKCGDHLKRQLRPCKMLPFRGYTTFQSAAWSIMVQHFPHY